MKVNEIKPVEATNYLSLLNDKNKEEKKKKKIKKEVKLDFEKIFQECLKEYD